MVPKIIVNDSEPIGFDKIESTKGEILSAKNIFFKKPNAIKVIPNLRFDLWITIWRSLLDVWEFSIFSRSCGKNSFALSIGPATSCGKNDTNKANSQNDLLGDKTPR